nr:hypothetical protein [Natrinema soli]
MPTQVIASAYVDNGGTDEVHNEAGCGGRRDRWHWYDDSDQQSERARCFQGA